MKFLYLISALAMLSGCASTPDRGPSNIQTDTQTGIVDSYISTCQDARHRYGLPYEFGESSSSINRSSYGQTWTYGEMYGVGIVIISTTENSDPGAGNGRIAGKATALVLSFDRQCNLQSWYTY